MPRWLEPNSLGEQCGLMHWAESTLKAQLRMRAVLEAMLKEADGESTEGKVSMGKALCLECSENAHSHADPPGRGLDDSSLGNSPAPKEAPMDTAMLASPSTQPTSATSSETHPSLSPYLLN